MNKKKYHRINLNNAGVDTLIHPKEEKGITLIALIITIIVMLILVAVTVRVTVTSGLFKHTGDAVAKFSQSQVRELLSGTLAGAMTDKYTNNEYNKNEYLDEYIKEWHPDSEIVGDIVIIDGWAFEIDRDVPKIIKDLGKADELVYPKLTIETTIAENNKTATMKITAKEDKNGISKIEIIQEGVIIKEYQYDNKKDEIVENYIVNQNGKYTIKVYSKVNVTKVEEINALVPSVIYNPNGDTTYKKEHSLTVETSKEITNIKGIKYQWLDTTVEPELNTFTEEYTIGETIRKNEVTGKWYLWTLLETEDGKKIIDRSEAFNFDNMGPDATLESNPTSETEITLIATAKDNETEIAKYEFYVDNKLEERIETKEERVEYRATGLEMGIHECYIIVTDSLGNQTRVTTNSEARTKMHMWEKYNVEEKITGYEEYISDTYQVGFAPGNSPFRRCSSVKFNSTTGQWGFYVDSSYSSDRYTGYAADTLGSGQWTRPRIQHITYEKVNGEGLVVVTVKVYSSRPAKTTIKGGNKIGDVYSNNQSEYPTNNVQGNYWYVYTGTK